MTAIRNSRDTFASLKKTCRKHGISFWLYLRDRISGAAQIPRLSELIHQASTCGYVLMTAAGDEAVVTIIAKSSVKLGLIFLGVKRAAVDIAKLI